MIRLLIGDGHPLSRRGVRLQLEQHDDVEVVAETSDEAETVVSAISLRPDVVLLDASMPRHGALEVATRIRAEVPSCEVIILSGYFDEHLAADCFAAGAHGFLVTEDGPEDLVTCVRSVANHTPFVSPTVRTRLKGRPQEDYTAILNGLRTLTRRERRIVQLIAEGLRTREIAAFLEISEKTVETHRSAIFRKLDLDTVADVVRYAIRNSMVDL